MKHPITIEKEHDSWTDYYYISDAEGSRLATVRAADLPKGADAEKIAKVIRAALSKIK